MTKTVERVRSIITLAVTDNRMEPVFPPERLDALGLDSLDRWEMVLKIEEEFRIDIEQEETAAWVTVQDVINSVLNAAPPAAGIAGDTLPGPGKVMTYDTWPAAAPSPINRITRDDVYEFEDQSGKNADPRLPDSLDHYQSIATKSAIYPGKGTPFGLMYAALGLAEAGEVQNKVKKAFRDDGVINIDEPETINGAQFSTVEFNPITLERKAQIIKEMGGVLWYLSAVADELGVQLSDVALKNLEELCSRTERDTLRGDGDNR